MKKFSGILVLMLANILWIGIGGLGLAYASSARGVHGPQPLLAADSGGMVLMLVIVGVVVLIIASMWKVFEKAGKPGWACIVPIYNLVVLLEIAGRPIWWILLFFIPLVSVIISIILAIDVAKSFGQGAGFGIGLAFLPFIFYPVLGLGSAQYQGPAGLGYGGPDRMDYR